MDERKNLDRIDELLESTSAENRIKFKLSDIETTESTSSLEERFGAAPEENIPSPTIDVEPVTEEPVFPEPMPVEEPAPEAEIADEPSAVVNEQTKAENKKEKKAKGKGKFSVLQIVLIVVVAVATLWTVMYTVDHTLAAQGISPMFAFSETEYDDGSLSYKCLGYKVQFMFDSNDNLTQKCVPFWKDGPNDIRYDQGLLFEVTK